MTELGEKQAMLWGCDATHRASNLDTHLTHGCIQLFRHFLRVRKGCVGFSVCGNRAFPPLFEGAPRTLTETV